MFPPTLCFTRLMSVGRAASGLQSRPLCHYLVTLGRLLVFYARVLICEVAPVPLNEPNRDISRMVTV